MITTYISKDESNAIKGIAILLMLFYHLFNRVTEGVEYVWVGEQPLTKFLSTAAYPVPFFLMMSGYGLYYSCQKGRVNAKSNGARALKLYVHYWMVMLIFVTIGLFLVPWHYPGSLTTFLENFIGIHCTYNYETWFLLPYIILSVLSPYIFKLLDKLSPIWMLCLAFLVSFGAQFFVSRFVATGIVTNVFIGLFMATSGLLFPFVIGACMKICASNYDNVEKKENNSFLRWFICVTLLLILVVLRCKILFPWSSFYTFLVIVLFINMPHIKCIDKVLMELGRKSMVMWMVHTYFCIYLFHDFIYGFRYPIVIWMVLALISYLCSIIIMKLCNLLLCRLLSKSTI